LNISIYINIIIKIEKYKNHTNYKNYHLKIYAIIILKILYNEFKELNNILMINYKKGNVRERFLLNNTICYRIIIVSKHNYFFNILLFLKEFTKIYKILR